MCRMKVNLEKEHVFVSFRSIFQLSLHSSLWIEKKWRKPFVPWPERQYEALSFIFRGTVVSKEKDTSIDKNEFVKKRKKFAIKFRG